MNSFRRRFIFSSIFIFCSGGVFLVFEFVGSFAREQSFKLATSRRRVDFKF